MSERQAPTPTPLGMVVHSLPRPEGAVAAQRRKGRHTALLVLLACLAPVAISYWMYFFGAPAGSTAYGQLIQPARAMPAQAQAHDLDGRPVPLASLQGQWLLIAVQQGPCDRDCERRLYAQRQLREMLGRDRDRLDKVLLLLDDADLSPALRTALAAPPAVTVLRLPSAVAQAWLESGPGHALRDHLYVADPYGDWMMRQPPQPEPAKVKRDLDRLLKASASWDRAGRGPSATAPYLPPAPAASR